jgi:hypothetical protein
MYTLLLTSSMRGRSLPGDEEEMRDREGQGQNVWEFG